MATYWNPRDQCASPGSRAKPQTANCSTGVRHPMPSVEIHVYRVRPMWYPLGGSKLVNHAIVWSTEDIPWCNQCNHRKAKEHSRQEHTSINHHYYRQFISFHDYYLEWLKVRQTEQSTASLVRSGLYFWRRDRDPPFTTLKVCSRQQIGFTFHAIASFSMIQPDLALTENLVHLKYFEMAYVLECQPRINRPWLIDL